MNQYNPQQYWEQRLSHRLDITTVGHAGLGRVYNSWLYKARFRALKVALQTLQLSAAGRSIVELGVGSGVWIPFWNTYAPASLTGIDITSVSVQTLEAQYPRFRFFRADLAAPLMLEDSPHFDIVTAFDVLFHIVDDAGFSQAIANIGMLAAPNGWVIIGDSFCLQSQKPSFHVYHRSYAHYVRELERAKITPVLIQPIFYTMSETSCEECSKLLGHLTRLHLRAVRALAARPRLEAFNHIPGLILYALDGLLMRACKCGPSLKFLIGRKALS